MYIEIEEDGLVIYPAPDGNSAIDQTGEHTEVPMTTSERGREIPVIKDMSFDLDFFAIPLKYRPAQQNVPPQFNAELNGAVYFGLRLDRHKLNYSRNAFGQFELEENHLGLSVGGFTGFGSTFMSPTTTANAIEQEYDGIVWSKGVAGIVAVNRFTLGLALGFDSLLDGNRSVWIYQNRPWLGLILGINLI